MFRVLRSIHASSRYGRYLVAIMFGMIVMSASAGAADVAAGRIAAQSKCAQCHQANDWEGEDAASLQSLIQDIVAGKVKHKNKFELTAPEIANVAAYWALGKR